jgi:hypothetical protein
LPALVVRVNPSANNEKVHERKDTKKLIGLQ